MGLHQGGGLRCERDDPLAHLGAVAVSLGYTKVQIPQASVCARRIHADTWSPEQSSWRNLPLGVRRERTAMPFIQYKFSNTKVREKPNIYSKKQVKSHLINRATIFSASFIYSAFILVVLKF